LQLTRYDFSLRVNFHKMNRSKSFSNIPSPSPKEEMMRGWSVAREDEVVISLFESELCNRKRMEKRVLL